MKLKQATALTMTLCLGVSALTACSGSASGTAATTAATSAETDSGTGAPEGSGDSLNADSTASEEASQSAEDAAGSESADETADRSGSDLDKLVFTYVTSPLNVPTIIERDQEIFASAFGDMGISVEYAELTSGADQTQALASGDVQVLYAVGATSVILSAANGADIKVLNMYSRSPKAFCLYSTDDTLTSPESLAGKTIAGPVGTNLHELLVAYLATADMTLDDVNYVNMSIPDAVAALNGGSIDVAMIAGPSAYQASQDGFHLVTDGEGLINAIIAVAVTDEFYQAHPESIEQLETCQADISTFMNDRPDDTMAIVAESLDLDVSAVEDMYQYYDFSTEISGEDIAGFQRTADFMLENGMIDEAIDVNTLFFE